MKNREIVQICESISNDTRIPMVSLTALCNDGSVWRLIGANWKPLPSIPQHELDQDEFPDSDIDPEEYPEEDQEEDVGPQDIDPEWRKRRF